MKKLFKALLPVLVLVTAGTIAAYSVSNRETPTRRVVWPVLPTVDVMLLARSDYPLRLQTRGTVRARTESTLIPEISGTVVRISPQLRAGEFFEAGDVLLEIDPRDYRAEVMVAEANLEQARAAEVEEQARAAQAAAEWQGLGEAAEPDPLVLRKPQLASARALIKSAEARLLRARLSLERTVIRAPYAGRVLEQGVDVAQYVAPGTVLARIYAVDYAEIRLPLSNRQLEFVDLPERYRGNGAGVETAPQPRVWLSARIGSKTHTWAGRVVRTEGAIDTQSRQLFVVAQVDDPYGKGPVGRPPLKLGQFVEAAIEGREFKQVFVIPRAALRAGGRLLLADADDRIQSRMVKVLWQDAENVVVGDGLAEGERLVLTALGGGMEGVKVRPNNRAAAGDRP